MSKCDKCATDRFECHFCPDNPEYVHIDRISRFTAYKPTCPRGYKDCINDPAYIKFHHPTWYRDMYGYKTPEEAAEGCRMKASADHDEEEYCYDDEDK